MTGYLKIRLNAISQNWQLLNKQTQNTQCGAVVKADAYGLGVVEVVETLFTAGCRTFFVATMDEAIELRERVKKNYQLVVFGGQAVTHPNECKHHNITPVLVSYDQVLAWLNNKQDALPVPILKFDSGMHRFGLSPADMDRLLSRPELLARLNPSYFMSHLACADSAKHLQNTEQLKLFSDYFKRCKKHLPNLKASLANSAACFLDEDYHFDLCRPGIALYGGNPTPTLMNPMQPVVQLELPIIQIKTLNPGDTVGYGADFKATTTMRIAIVFGGYADGLFRCLAGKGRGFIGGQAVPMVGRVSMDAIAFDITHIAPTLLESGSHIELLGEHQSIDDLAALANTISYEVLTSLGHRYQRRYITA